MSKNLIIEYEPCFTDKQPGPVGLSATFYHNGHIIDKVVKYDDSVVVSYNIFYKEPIVRPLRAPITVMQVYNVPKVILRPRNPSLYKKVLYKIVDFFPIRFNSKNLQRRIGFLVNS